MNARKSLAAALGAVVGAGLLGALATPAQAYGIQTVSSTGWAYTDSQLPDSSFVDPAGDAPIGSWADAAGKRHKSRSYFTIDVSTFAGKAVHEADLVLWERSAADCAQAQPVELWRTDPVTATTSWNHAPKQRELLATVQAGGAGQSCPGPLEWDVAPALQKLAARGERTLTVEVRVPRGVEGDLTHGRKLKTPAVLDTMTNTPPTVARTGLEYPSWACGTARKPQPVGPRTYNLMVQMSDVDSPDQLNGEFAVWPVGHEDQRVERSGARFGSLSKLEWDMSQHPDGTVLAWTARAFDGHDYSAWAKPCYVVVDAFAPAAPVVGSALYPNDGAAHGGPNVTGTFTFTGGADVVGYYWGQHGEATTFVPASKPGAAVSLQYAPGSSGSDALYVRAVDSADNRSPITEYDFEVRSTAPDVRVTMGGVGLPSRLDITTRFPGVTGFGYRIGAADEVRVPAVAGAASVDVVFPAPGWVPVEVRAYAGSEFLGAYKEDVNVVDKPHVESADFGAGHDGVYGQPGTFTFRPGRAGVVAYAAACSAATRRGRRRPAAGRCRRSRCRPR
ncbi:hypothetical protein [Asanoa sp. NPDC050611]|uniref:hypothetical protein n=1 Tax=Asanoa sp. NPDC050611 TaxID=3157098 RepID=UPI0034042544